jgi:hypothetical protein
MCNHHILLSRHTFPEVWRVPFLPSSHILMVAKPVTLLNSFGNTGPNPNDSEFKTNYSLLVN